MRTSIFATLLIIALGAWSTAVAAMPSSDEVLELQKQARAKMRVIDYERAIPLLMRALTGKLSPPQKAELNTDLGICYASIGHTEQAHASFDAALNANILLDLPVGTSPKIRQLFESVRAQHGKAVAAATAAVAAAPSEPITARIMPLDYILSGTVVAAVAAGIITGIVSSNAANDLQNGLHDRSVVDNLSGRQRSFGVASICSYGVAGAAAVTEVAMILFWNRRPAEPQGKVSVSGRFLPSGGAAAAVQVRF